MTPDQKRRAAELLREDALYLMERQIRPAEKVLVQWQAEHIELITLAAALEDESGAAP